LRLSHRAEGYAAQEAPENGDRQQHWQKPAASKEQNAERRDNSRIRRNAEDLGRGPAASLQRRKQRLSGECESKDEIPYPTGKPAPAEGEESPRTAERPRFVPHAAFNEERTRRQQLEAENRRLSEDRARFDERLRVIQEMNQPQPQPQPQPLQKPDRNVDPISTIEYLENKIEALEQNWQHGSQQWNEQQQRAEQVRWIAQAASSDADRVKAEVPDYDQAYRFWLQSRAGEMQAYGLQPSEIGQALQREELEISAGAFQRGVSPAETLYQIAQQRGYRVGNGRTGNGQDGAAEQIRRVATGQQRNQTLSGTGGGATPTAMTADRLLSMSNEEFDAWTTKNPAAADRLMGKDPPRRRV
jgi:hypothetical protein